MSILGQRFKKSPSAMDRMDWLLACAGALLFGLAFSYPVLGRMRQLGLHNDWDLFWYLRWVPYHTVHHFRQMPLWNPYRCGGNPMFADPQTSIFTPFFLLELIAGPVMGVHLEIPLHLAIAWIGGYVLARTMRLSRLGAAAAASIFPASSWFSLHLAEGHLWILPTAYLPFVGAGLWASIERGKLLPAAIAGLFVAMTILEGGPYVTAQAGLLAGLIALTASLCQRRIWPLVALLVLGSFAAGFGAIKLLPTWEFMWEHPRPMDFHEWNDRWMMVAAFLSRNQGYHREWSARWRFHEYGAYVGVVGAALATLGLFAGSRRRVPWIVALVVFLLLGKGDGGISFSPAALLHRLPPFTTERVASRFFIPAVLAISVLAGFGADFLARHFKRVGFAVALLLIAAVLVDAWLVGATNLRYIFDGTEPVIAAGPQFQQHRHIRKQESLAWLLANKGTIVCDDCVMGGARSSVVGDDEAVYMGEQRVSGSGTVTLRTWTPNFLTYDVDMTRPGMLVINQNYDRSWHLARGIGRVRPEGGLIGIELPSGRQVVTLKYRDDSSIGSIITLLTCVGAVALYRRDRGPLQEFATPP